MSDTGREQVLQQLRQYGTNSFSGLLLYDGVRFCACTRAQGFIGYMSLGKLRVVIGEPICAPQHYRVAVEEFRNQCCSGEEFCVFVGVGETFRQAVEDLGVTCIRIGDDFLFDVQTYAPRGNGAKNVRLARNRALRAGVVVKEYHPGVGEDHGIKQQLTEVADRWMKARPPLGAFLMDLDLFALQHLKRYFYAEVEDKPVALVTCLPIYGRRGYLLEDAIRDPSAPYGVTELIVLEALRQFKEEGLAVATFGISPHIDTHSVTGLGRRSWSHLLVKLAAAFTEHSMHLSRLYHFRKKFRTGRAEPAYLIKLPAGLGVLDVVEIIRGFMHK